MPNELRQRRGGAEMVASEGAPEDASLLRPAESVETTPNRWQIVQSAYTTPSLMDVNEARSKMYMHLNNKHGRLSFKFRLLYSAPQIVLSSVSTLIIVYTPSFYENLGASFQYIAFFTAVTRCMDLVLDPFISYLSDSFRGPFGRRRPFMFVGCFIYALMLIMYLTPPGGLGEFSMAMWYGVTSAGFFVANSFTSIPYGALGMELASKYHDRTLLYYTSAMCELFGSILLIGLSQLLYSNSTILEQSCDNSSCYSSSGLGESCRTRHIDDTKRSFPIFDVFAAPAVQDSTTEAPHATVGFTSNICTHENGTHYIDPQHFFEPSKCSTLVPSGSGALLPITELEPWSNAQLANYEETSWRERTSQCLRTYCECIAECTELCQVESTREQYSSLSLIVGCIFVACCCTLVYHARERSQRKNKTASVPHVSPLSAIVRALRNSAFRKMLPTFICDNMAYNIVTATMLYFVKYIVQPEKQMRADGDSLDCNLGVVIPDHESDSWRCSSASVLGALLVVMLAAGLLSCSIWYQCCVRFGKRNTWIAWSLATITSLFLLLAVGKGQIDLALILAVFPGMTIGGRFIGMSILADVIEYDEFISGDRNEASYIMLKNLLPKLFSIPVISLPLVLASLYPEYSDAQQRVVYAMIIGVPLVLLFISILYKLSMPLRYKEQCDLIGDGIGLRLLGLASPDPITGKDFSPPQFTNAELRKLDVLDHFPLLEDALDMHTALEAHNVLVSVGLLIERVRDQTFYLFIALAGLVTGVALTWNLFNSRLQTIYPMVLSLVSALTLLILILSFLRLRASIKLKQKDYRITRQLIEKVIAQRRLFDSISKADSVDIVGISEARRRLRLRLKSGMKLTSEEESEILGRSEEDALDADSDSDGDQPPGRRSGEGKGSKVVDHWKAIINMKNTTQSDNSQAKDSEDVSETHNYATIIRTLNNKIANEISIQNDVWLTSSLASKRLNKNMTKIKDFMTAEEYPTNWDLEFHSFVTDQAQRNESRTAEEVAADIEYSKFIGDEETRHDWGESSSSSSSKSSRSNGSHGSNSGGSSNESRSGSDASDGEQEADEDGSDSADDEKGLNFNGRSGNFGSGNFGSGKFGSGKFGSGKFGTRS